MRVYETDEELCYKIAEARMIIDTNWIILNGVKSGTHTRTDKECVKLMNKIKTCNTTFTRLKKVQRKRAEGIYNKKLLARFDTIEPKDYINEISK